MFNTVTEIYGSGYEHRQPKFSQYSQQASLQRDFFAHSMKTAEGELSQGFLTSALLKVLTPDYFVSMDSDELCVPWKRTKHLLFPTLALGLPTLVRLSIALRNPCSHI